jgi:glycosyltransferase involved in cell wall biosynthesis
MSGTMQMERRRFRPARQERDLLVLGGSTDQFGGLEAFCSNSAQALTEHGGWRIERIATSSSFLSLKRLGSYLRGLRELIVHRGAKPDIVWLQYANMPDLIYVLVAKALGMRVMVTPHLGSSWRSQDDRFLRWASKRMLRYADRLAMLSRTQELEINLPDDVPRSLIRNFLPERVLAMSPPDLETMPPTLQLIHSSRLSEGKGTFLVVEVCARLRDAGLPFEARITGGADAATMKRLVELVRHHKLEGQIAILGRVPEQELLDHLRRADVLIHLSKVDSYPLVVLEAMACSTVPVAMELAGARDMIDTYGGHVVSTQDPVGETAAWLLSHDLAALRRMRAEVSSRVRSDYGWKHCAAALDRALTAALPVSADNISVV